MIIGEKQFLKSLEKMSVADLHAAASRSIRLVQAEAKLLCPVNHGELRDSIYTSTEWTADTVRSTCYTNKKHGKFVEFGTGPKGQENHEGVAPDVAYAYGQSPWWIHESDIDPVDAERYGWFYIDTPQGGFYQCTGQAAQPFLYPALKNQEDRIAEIFGEELVKQL